MLSVIFSATDESCNHLFWDSLERIDQLQSNLIETIVVIDMQKNSSTVEKINSLFPKCQLIHSTTNLRSERINRGIDAAKFHFLLLQHPRSTLPPNAYLYLIDKGNNIPWGGFRHSFDKSHPLLNFTSWYSNFVRLKLSSIVYLDHCIFINRNYFKKVNIIIPEVDIFEDTVLSQILKNRYPATLINIPCKTSSVRFSQNGIYKQAILNQLLKIGFHAGISHQKMNKIYEKGLSLNSDYAARKNEKEK